MTRFLWWVDPQGTAVMFCGGGVGGLFCFLSLALLLPGFHSLQAEGFLSVEGVCSCKTEPARGCVSTISLGAPMGQGWSLP